MFNDMHKFFHSVAGAGTLLVAGDISLNGLANTAPPVGWLGLVTVVLQLVNTILIKKRKKVENELQDKKEPEKMG